MSDPTPEPYAWVRQKGENPSAYAAFDHFLRCGSARTIRRTAEALGRSDSAMERLSVQWRWQARSLEFDRHQAAVEQDALDRAISARVELWTARHFALCEDDYQTACELRKKAREILSLPGAEANWTGATAVSAAKIASELASASIDRAMHEPSLDDVDAAKLDPEAAARWMARFDLTERARRKAMLAASTPAE